MDQFQFSRFVDSLHLGLGDIQENVVQCFVQGNFCGMEIASQFSDSELHFGLSRMVVVRNYDIVMWVID